MGGIDKVNKEYENSKVRTVVSNSGKTVVMPETDDIECTVISSGKQVCFRPMVLKTFSLWKGYQHALNQGRKDKNRLGWVKSRCASVLWKDYQFHQEKSPWLNLKS